MMLTPTGGKPVDEHWREGATLADAVAAWLNVDGDSITEVLELLGRDDRKPLAKAARKALFKRRSSS
jgi:hypothetical protein